MGGKVYIKLLEAIDALNDELKKTTSNPEQLLEDVKVLYDMVNSYKPPTLLTQDKEKNNEQ